MKLLTKKLKSVFLKDSKRNALRGYDRKGPIILR